MGKYDDIINLPRHKSKTHPQMSLNNRAAQFAPFSALVGYEEAIRDSRKIKEEEIQLIDDKKEEIELILHDLQPSDKVKIKHYLNSDKVYDTTIGIIKKIDANNKCIVLNNSKIINLDEIIEINKEL